MIFVLNIRFLIQIGQNQNVLFMCVSISFFIICTESGHRNISNDLISSRKKEYIRKIDL